MIEMQIYEGYAFVSGSDSISPNRALRFISTIPEGMPILVSGGDIANFQYLELSDILLKRGALVVHGTNRTVPYCDLRYGYRLGFSSSCEIRNFDELNRTLEYCVFDAGRGRYIRDERNNIIWEKVELTPYPENPG